MAVNNLGYVCLILSFVSMVYCKSFYDFSATDIKGKPVKFSTYKGKALLVVNVASECGFTDDHYKALVKAKKVHGADGHFEILAFPCNQFGAQEPKKESEIAKFVKEKYKVNFPMFSKINVINEDVADFFKFLIDETNTTPNWNFFKYLVDHNGKVLKAYPPQVSVEEVVPDIVAQVRQIKSQKASMDHIKEALAKAQAKMGQKAGGLKFEIKDDL